MCLTFVSSPHGNSLGEKIRKVNLLQNKVHQFLTPALICYNIKIIGDVYLMEVLNHNVLSFQHCLLNNTM